MANDGKRTFLKQTSEYSSQGLQDRISGLQNKNNLNSNQKIVFLKRSTHLRTKNVQIIAYVGENPTAHLTFEQPKIMPMTLYV